MTLRIRLRRSRSRFEAAEYALSATTGSGLRRGGPPASRGTARRVDNDAGMGVDTAASDEQRVIVGGSDDRNDGPMYRFESRCGAAGSDTTCGWWFSIDM